MSHPRIYTKEEIEADIFEFEGIKVYIDNNLCSNKLYSEIYNMPNNKIKGNTLQKKIVQHYEKYKEEHCYPNININNIIIPEDYFLVLEGNVTEDVFVPIGIFITKSEMISIINKATKKIILIIDHELNKVTLGDKILH